MRHGNDRRKLGRTTSHRKAFLKNMVRNLMIYESIRTTLPKAKEAQRAAEKLITLAKEDTLKNKRAVYDIIQDHALTSKIFSEVGPRFKGRPGGYTAIKHLGIRPGDGAQLAILRLVELKAKAAPKDKKSSDKEGLKIKKQDKVPEAADKKGKAPQEADEKRKETKQPDKKKEQGFFKGLRKYLGKDNRPEGN